MKQSIKRAVITDPTNSFFWLRNAYYDRTVDDRSIFLSTFTNSLVDASIMLEEDAKETLKRFKENKYNYEYRIYVKGILTELDIQSLVVSTISITYEQDS